ncbi:hypothetical protein K466DRAFT_498414 [Polyporus arcularius HHB13444]|uniref:DUF6533 domain-containing protein n=1 Tax=Polyporus arcularius HHB13444 TaxID=1314778 RepID=A0A5C3P5C3_9APHY|nr:hypothetical protein K466DRAFT_498414 [Polyporus arcularius HHB13444]
MLRRIPGVAARLRQPSLPALPSRVINPDELDIAICAGRGGVLVRVGLPSWHLAYELTCLRRASSVRFNNYLTLVGLTVLYYDYCLTFFSEVELFWKSANVSTVSVLFVIIRYYGLVGPIPLIFEYFVDLPEDVSCHSSCRQLQTYHQAFAISCQGIVAVMLVVRTYALYDRSRRILALLIVTHLGGAIACLITVVTSHSPIHTVTPLPFTYSGCNLSLTNEQIDLALAWSAMLWFDTTIFVLTLVQALRVRRYFPGGLLEIMFRDGTIYYGFLVVSNVCNIITFMVSSSSGSPLKGMDTTLTNVLSTTLTSRLILNIRDPSLRHVQRTTTGWDDTTAAPMTSAGFTLTQIEALSVDTQISEDRREYF